MDFTNTEPILLVDAYGGHKNATFQKKADELNIDIHIMPKSTTRFCQPLDIYFFRQYKIIVRRIVNSARDRFLDKVHAVKPKDRLFIIKMHSIVYNQLQAPIYRPMLLYAWRKPGYDTTSDVPEKFLSVLEVNFSYRKEEL